MDRWSRNGPVLVIFVLGLIASVIMLTSTPWGSGLGGDSYFYVSGARNLANGLGFSRYAGTGELRAITHYPPFYSALLALPAYVGIDPILGARWINALVFGANVFVIGLLLHQYTGSFAVAALGSLVVLGSRLMLTIHSWVLAEGPFILLMLLWVLCLTRYLIHHRRGVLAAASVLAALCFLTRYFGSSVIATGFLLVGFFPGRAVRQRWIDTFLLALGSLVPSALWLTRNYLLTGSFTNRIPGWHPMPLERVYDGVDAVSLWLAPEIVPAAARHLLAVGVLVGLVIAGVGIMGQLYANASLQTGQAAAGTLLVGLWSFLLIYALLLATSLSVFDAATPVDGRILSPAFPAAFLFLGAAGHIVTTARSTPRLLRISMIGLAALLGAVSLVQGILTVTRLLRDGQGFAGRAWQQSELVRYAARLPQEAPIYSNEIDAIYLLTGKTANLVPVRWDPVRELPSAGYQASLELMRSRLRDGNGALVLFNTIERQEGFLATVEDLAKGLQPALEAPDGVVYTAPEDGACPSCP